MNFYKVKDRKYLAMFLLLSFFMSLNMTLMVPTAEACWIYLDVTKTFIGCDNSVPTSITFQVHKLNGNGTGDAWVSGDRTITFGPNDTSKTVNLSNNDGLYGFGHYYVVETAINGHPLSDYTTTYSSSDLDLSGENDHQYVTITNTLKQVEPGSISFTKTLPDGVTPLKDAIFELKQNGISLVPQVTATSQINGTVEFSQITPGDNYSIVETYAPTGYVLPANPVVFSGTISSGLNHTTPGICSVVTNTPIPRGSITVFKTVMSQNPLDYDDYFWFELQDNTGTVIDTKSATCIPPVPAVFSNLDPSQGPFKVVEVASSSAGYSETFDLTANSYASFDLTSCLNQVTICNNLKNNKGTIDVEKDYSADTPDVLKKEVHFTLLKDNAPYSPATTNVLTTNLKYTFTDLPAGTYSVVEDPADQIGFTVVSAPPTVTIDTSTILGQSNLYGKVVFTNTWLPKGSLTVNKVWADKNGPLASPASTLNASFEVKKDGNLITGGSFTLTGTDTQKVFNDLPYGIYNVKEISGPADFEATYSVTGGNVTLNSSTADITVTNTYDPKGKLTVDKTWYGDDGSTIITDSTFKAVFDITCDGAVISGSPFTLYNNGDSIELTDLPCGTYKVVEQNVPHYVTVYPNGTDYKVTAQNPAGTINVKNTKVKPGTITVTKQYEHGAPVPVKFQLFKLVDGSEALVAESPVIDAAGSYSFAVEETGRYIIKELYLISTNPDVFEDSLDHWNSDLYYLVNSYNPIVMESLEQEETIAVVNTKDTTTTVTKDFRDFPDAAGLVAVLQIDVKSSAAGSGGFIGGVVNYYLMYTKYVALGDGESYTFYNAPWETYDITEIGVFLKSDITYIAGSEPLCELPTAAQQFVGKYTLSWSDSHDKYENRTVIAINSYNNPGGHKDPYTPPTNNYTPPTTTTPTPTAVIPTPATVTPQPAVVKPQSEVIVPQETAAVPEAPASLPKTGAEGMANIMLLASMFAGSGLVLRRTASKKDENE